MNKEYKTLHFNDNEKGRKEMADEINKLSLEGWELKSKEASQQGYDCGSTCCLGAIFLPLALLGRKDNIITVIMERTISEKVIDVK